MSKHEWRENTPDGDVRYVAARRHGAQWQFRTRLKSEEHWTLLDVVPLEDLEYLREILFNKYQRRRVPYEQIQEIDALISESGDHP
jgi:hypothetical protein